MSDNVIQMEAMPTPEPNEFRVGNNMGHFERLMTICRHARLTFDFISETVTCRSCGLVWRDFVGEAERAHKANKIIAKAVSDATRSREDWQPLEGGNQL